MKALEKQEKIAISSRKRLERGSIQMNFRHRAIVKQQSKSRDLITFSHVAADVAVFDSCRFVTLHNQLSVSVTVSLS